MLHLTLNEYDSTTWTISLTTKLSENIFLYQLNLARFPANKIKQNKNLMIKSLDWELNKKAKFEFVWNDGPVRINFNNKETSQSEKLCSIENIIAEITRKIY